MSCHNALQIDVLDPPHSLFQATIQVALVKFYQQEGHVQLLLAHHRDIMKKIAAHDQELARKMMMEYLAMVEEKMAQLLRT